MARYDMNEVLGSVFEYPVAGLRTTDAGSTYQTQIDYVSGTNPIYVGTAPRGLATSSSGWLIKKLTYDVNNNVTVVQTAALDGTNIWDNRAAITYA